MITKLAKSIRAKLKELSTGILKWPAFLIAKALSKDLFTRTLIYGLIKQKKYQAAERMMKLHFKGLRDSLQFDCIPLEEKLEIQRHFWEIHLGEKYDPFGIVRLAGIYQKLGKDNLAFQLLKFSFEHIL